MAIMPSLSWVFAMVACYITARRAIAAGHGGAYRGSSEGISCWVDARFEYESWYRRQKVWVVGRRRQQRAGDLSGGGCELGMRPVPD